MEFMSWSLNAPSSSVFDKYMKKENGEWSIVDSEAINSWGDSNRNMFHMFQENHAKVSDLGLHEFGVRDNGEIYDYRATSYNILDDKLNEIKMWVPTSLQYLMETYPNINYSIQPICFGQKVDKFLHVNRDESIPNFINHLKTIAGIYQDRWSQVNTIELDFEKVYTLREGDPIYDDKDSSDRVVIGHAVGDDWDVYADFIKQVKDEVCIPLGMKLRVNMYAMTGDFNPHYYGWHDYKTLASRNDINGDQAIDEFQIMSYDFTYAYSAPGPSTPQWWLKDILNHVDDSLPNERTWIGNAGYGRRWGLDGQQSGSTVTYHQLLMWQNGMYVHNHGEQDDGKWIWHNQPWLPFAGFNDGDSGYQETYLHLYDKFFTHFSDTVQGKVNYTTYKDDEIITSYFKSQQPKFTGIKGVGNKAKRSGNISSYYATNGETVPAIYLGKEYHFSGAYRGNKAQYEYDKETESCVLVPDESGEDGNIDFDIDIDSSGSYKLIALVHFNTLENNEINGALNGTGFKVGGDKLDDWFPFYVDKTAWVEVGTFDFNKSNEIKVSPSSGYIWGFVICDEFDQNFLGGTVEFDSYLAPYYKRGNDGRKEIASMPDQMTLTGEILRRPPRPAIIFEDNFSHFLANEDIGLDITTVPYYMRIQEYWDSGGNKVYHEGEGAYACTDSKGITTKGFTDGAWRLQADGTVKAEAGFGISYQLVLYKKLKSNIQIRADINVSGTYPKAGIRLLADREGDGNEGYLALLDYQKNKVVIGHEDGKGNWNEIDSAFMSGELEGQKGQMISMYASIHNGKAYVTVGSTEYLSGVDLGNVPTSGAYGVYISEGSLNASMFNVSTIDRYEPMEKMEVEIDNQTYEYGEVKRLDDNGEEINYDKYGYLIYSGLDIDGLGEPEPEIPDDEGGSASLDFDEDYTNTPLAKHPSWEGNKKVRVRMVDAGIWFSMFYIGDSEGYSVAYNSDFIGFVETTKLLFEHKCKGVAMWTMGQEDPLVFDYLPTK